MRPRFTVFPAIIFVLLGMNMIVVGITLWVAFGDPSFAVEPDYDIKAANWQETVEARTRAHALGWSVTPIGATVGSPLRLVVRDRDGAPLTDATAEAVTFHHAYAGLRREFPLVDVGDGQHTSVEPFDRAGTWHVRTSILRGEHRLLSTFDIVVREPGG